MNLESVITITFGDMAENHVGMEQIGEMVSVGQGFNLDDLVSAKQTFENLGAETNLINLSSVDLTNFEDLPNAYLLIIKNGVNIILENESTHNLNDMFNEQLNLNVDKKAFMYGRVVNKKARWNLCFNDESSEPDYPNGKGRVISWNDVPITNIIYENLEKYFGPKANNLKGEGNYYYNPSHCGIGYHGDSERRKVIGVRLGASLPLHYQWYYKGNAKGNNMKFDLDGGDIYIMSEKTVGTDWKKKNIYTLRHAAGADKFVEL